MLVWDNDERNAVERIVIEVFANGYCFAVADYSESEFNTGGHYGRVKWFHYKPIPEKKPMTALDVMYWAGIRKVARNNGTERIINALFIDSSDDIDCWKHNELIHKDGETKLKWDEWKEFNWDNCPIEKKA